MVDMAHSNTYAHPEGICMSGLAEVQARRIVKNMQRLRHEVEVFATHAKTLREASHSIDGRPLLQEADNLLRGLTASRLDFLDATAHVGSLSRSLSSRPPATGGPPPAARWGSEFRAGTKQFIAAVQKAEKELNLLYGVANSQLNSPIRTATGTPENLTDIVMAFIDLLSRWIDYRRSQNR
jgi:hypothetical protein